MGADSLSGGGLLKYVVWVVWVGGACRQVGCKEGYRSSERGVWRED